MVVIAWVGFQNYPKICMGRDVEEHCMGKRDFRFVSDGG